MRNFYWILCFLIDYLVGILLFHGQASYMCAHWCAENGDLRSSSSATPSPKFVAIASTQSNLETPTQPGCTCRRTSAGGQPTRRRAWSDTTTTTTPSTSWESPAVSLSQCRWTAARSCSRRPPSCTMIAWSEWRTRSSGSRRRPLDRFRHSSRSATLRLAVHIGCV